MSVAPTILEDTYGVLKTQHRHATASRQWNSMLPNGRSMLLMVWRADWVRKPESRELQSNRLVFSFHNPIPGVCSVTFPHSIHGHVHFLVSHSLPCSALQRVTNVNPMHPFTHIQIPTMVGCWWMSPSTRLADQRTDFLYITCRLLVSQWNTGTCTWK